MASNTAGKFTVKVTLMFPAGSAETTPEKVRKTLPASVVSKKNALRCVASSPLASTAA